MGLLVGIDFSSENNTVFIKNIDTKESMKIGVFTDGHINQKGLFNDNENNYEEPIPPRLYYKRNILIQTDPIITIGMGY